MRGQRRASGSSKNYPRISSTRLSSSPWLSTTACTPQACLLRRRLCLELVAELGRIRCFTTSYSRSARPWTTRRCTRADAEDERGVVALAERSEHGRSHGKEVRLQLSRRGEWNATAGRSLAVLPPGGEVVKKAMLILSAVVLILFAYPAAMIP